MILCFHLYLIGCVPEVQDQHVKFWYNISNILNLNATFIFRQFMIWEIVKDKRISGPENIR